MKKFLIILIFVISSQFQITNLLAASDCKLELTKNNKSIENTDVKDCFETVNRGVFAFNKALDGVFFKPVAKGYRYLPKPISQEQAMH